MLMQGMLTLLELICAIFLEKNTAKTSDNSSKPSSQTNKDESALGQKIRNGKGKKEHAGLATNTRVAEFVTLSEMTRCPIYGEDLTLTRCYGQERLFAKDGNVSFTNNRAERDLRMSKVKQKV